MYSVTCCCHKNILHLQDGTIPLWIACQNGHLPVVQYLIAANADVNHPDEVIYLTFNVHHSECSASSLKYNYISK